MVTSWLDLHASVGRGWVVCKWTAQRSRARFGEPQFARRLNDREARITPALQTIEKNECIDFATEFGEMAQFPSLCFHKWQDALDEHSASRAHGVEFDLRSSALDNQ